MNSKSYRKEYLQERSSQRLWIFCDFFFFPNCFLEKKRLLILKHLWNKVKKTQKKKMKCEIEKYVGLTQKEDKTGTKCLLWKMWLIRQTRFLKVPKLLKYVQNNCLLYSKISLDLINATMNTRGSETSNLHRKLQKVLPWIKCNTNFEIIFFV